MTNWRILITREMDIHADGWENVVQCTLFDHGLDLPFDECSESPKGKPFTVWTRTRVYFPAYSPQYGGEEWCASVSRNPDGRATDHVR